MHDTEPVLYLYLYVLYLHLYLYYTCTCTCTVPVLYFTALVLLSEDAAKISPSRSTTRDSHTTCVKRECTCYYLSFERPIHWFSWAQLITLTCTRLNKNLMQWVPLHRHRVGARAPSTTARRSWNRCWSLEPRHPLGADAATEHAKSFWRK